MTPLILYVAYIRMETENAWIIISWVSWYHWTRDVTGPLHPAAGAGWALSLNSGNLSSSSARRRTHATTATASPVLEDKTQLWEWCGGAVVLWCRGSKFINRTTAGCVLWCCARHGIDSNIGSGTRPVLCSCSTLARAHQWTLWTVQGWDQMEWSTLRRPDSRQCPVSPGVELLWWRHVQGCPVLAGALEQAHTISPQNWLARCALERGCCWHWYLWRWSSTEHLSVTPPLHRPCSALSTHSAEYPHWSRWLGSSAAELAALAQWMARDTQHRYAGLGWADHGDI